MMAFGNDELKKMKNIGKTAYCNGCGKRHKVEQSMDRDGIPTGLYFFTCPIDEGTYLVGVKGKDITGKTKRAKN